jgi:hypothetical protein
MYIGRPKSIFFIPIGGARWYRPASVQSFFLFRSVEQDGIVRQVCSLCHAENLEEQKRARKNDPGIAVHGGWK